MNVPGRTDVRIRIGAACASLGRWRRCAPPQPGWKERVQQPDGAHARRELADAHQLESGERRPHIPKAECAPRDGVQRREENEHIGGVRAREEAELAAAEQKALEAHGRRVDRESDAKQRGHRRHRRRHRRVLSEDAGAAEHDPNRCERHSAAEQHAHQQQLAAQLHRTLLRRPARPHPRRRRQARRQVRLRCLRDRVAEFAAQKENGRNHLVARQRHNSTRRRGERHRVVARDLAD
mmetsp:Transcript_28064/g.87797  ORF Transcript_28064/g.87797 Transcript_28064/m.87797 type:complete len:237 (-) Transcript_28064:1113-1823(-)